MSSRHDIQRTSPAAVNPRRLGASTAYRDFREKLGINAFMRSVRKNGMSTDTLGIDYIARLASYGITEVRTAEILSQVRCRTDWPMLWEAEALQRVASGEHMEASAAYLAAQRWYSVSVDLRSRLIAEGQAEYRRAEHRTPLERVEIPFGDKMICGYLQVPESSSPVPLMLAFPGIGTPKEELHPLVDRIVAEGIAILRIDLPGHGETTAIMNDEPRHIAGAALRHINSDSRIDTSRIHAVGWCTGGVYAAGASLEGQIASVTLISTPIQPLACFSVAPRAMREGLRRAMHVKTNTDAAEILKSVRWLNIPHITAPISLIYGGKDSLVPPSDMLIVEKYAQVPVEFHFFAEASHVLIGRFDDLFETIRNRILESSADVDEFAA